MSSISRPAHSVLVQRPEWAEAITRLRELADARRQDAVADAQGYVARYAGGRGAMVLDVVASRQRKYAQRVLPMVERWKEQVPAPTLACLVATPTSLEELGLRRTEPVTILTVAQNLLSYGAQVGLDDEDEICRQWADDTEGLEHGYVLDPVVGEVSGIGLALFSYIRMRAGASAIKPDVRVRRALRDLGFHVPRGEHAILTVARAAAAETGMDLLTFDQLLWHVGR